MMTDDLTMTDSTPSHPAQQPPKIKPPSYLIAYLQKSELFTNNNSNNNNNNPETKFPPKEISVSNNSSLENSRDSLHDHEHRLDDDGNTAVSGRNSLVEQFWADTHLHHYSSDGTGDEDIEDDEESDEDLEDLGDSDSYQDPDELTNLPYKSPAVYQLPGLGNVNKFRTLVRNGPVGSLEGELQRFVVIKRRSFRGAGLYPGEMVDVDVEMSGCVVLDDDQVVGDGHDEDDEERLEGEVEVMWSEDGEEFWLVRDPAEDGGIGKETSWVPREWFLLRRKMMTMGKGQPGKERERVELRVAMEED
ncbi:hypothetical protein TWF481_003902 [Arthrobotrys musiformis]|uniref:Uncharacterized protein n=1 Tax=Arthrobotrys musiformis TaxID=47236 RepID=A0AAV9WJZ7_9PEZI